MNEADDVLRSIDQLRRDLSGYHGQLKAHNDLQRHCDNQRRRIAELEGLYAKAKAEIAELREQTLWMAQTDARWEAAVRDCDGAKAENAKMRALCKRLIDHVEHPPCEGCSFDMNCDGEHVTQCDEWSLILADARKLGIEVKE